MARYLIPPTPPEDLPPPAPQPRDLNIPDEAFGARLAFNWLQPGEQLDPESRQQAATLNLTRASELQNQFLDRQRDILSTGPDAYLNTSGRDALLGADAAIARLDAARQEIFGQAANAAQRDLLSQALDDHRMVEHATVGDHVGRQMRAWRAATAAARLDQLRQQAALDYADPGAIDAYDRASESAASEHARMSGLRDGSDEAASALSKARSSIWRQAIEAALGRMDLKPAIALYERGEDRLEAADLDILVPMIDGARQYGVGIDYVGDLLPSHPQDLNELDAAHRAAIDRNAIDWPDDGSQRATNQHLIDVAFGQRKRDALKAGLDLVRDVSRWLDRSTSDGGPQIARPPLAIWTRLDPDQKREVDAVLARNALAGTADEGAGGDRNGDDRIRLAQSILPFLAKPPVVPEIPRGPGTRLPNEGPGAIRRFKEPVPNQSGKEGAKDIPSWAREEGIRPYIDETPAETATRAMNKHYGKGNWSKKTQRGDFQKLQKHYGRHFRTPKEVLPLDDGPFGFPGSDKVVSLPGAAAEG
ncbi:MAG: hypothetical protein JSR90_20035 [Proteobacteria bacterium]|nr:hypothetical protein [Pseudomonadota bacterium]